MTGARALTVLLSDGLLDLNRAVGVIRRRNLPINSIVVGPSAIPDVSRLTVILQTDDATADRLLKQLQKMVGVRRAVVFPVEDAVARELALIKVKASTATYAELLDVAALFKAAVVDEGPEELILQVAGPGTLILSLVRALEKFGIIDLARSGSVALERAAGATTLAQESIS